MFIKEGRTSKVYKRITTETYSSLNVKVLNIQMEKIKYLLLRINSLKMNWVQKKDF